MCSPSPPPPPDYAGAAVAQGAANREAALTTGKISNPWVSGPTGTRKVLYNTPTGSPYDDVPQIVEELTPAQQRIFDIGQQGQENLATVGRDATSRIGGILGQDVNFNRDLGTQAQGRQEVIDAMMSRYDKDLGRRRDQVNSDLTAQGIPRGSEAYGREMEMLDRGRNDALQQATLASDAKATDERRQAITEMMAQRQTPLNEISALRSGSQVAPPQFQPYSGANVQPAPIFQAAQAQGGADMNIYNQKAASSNSTNQALAGAAMAAMMMF